MECRKEMKRTLIVTALTIVAVASLSQSSVAQEPSLASQLQQAERILVVSPEKDIDVSGGEQFLVEILRVLRGSGQKGTLARVAQSGDAKNHPKFTAGKQYVFLLKKNAGDRGWVYLGDRAWPLVDNKVSYVDESGKAAQIALDDLQNLIAKNPFVATEAVARASLEGKWIVALSQQGTDFFVWLVEITKQGDKFQAQLLKTSKVMSASALKSSSVTADQAQFVFESDGQEFDFHGKLDSGMVKGNVSVDNRVVLAARMEPTESVLMTAYDQPKPTPGQEAFVAAAGKEKPFEPLSQFAESHGHSPLVLDAYRQLINTAREDKLDQPQVEKLAEAYVATATKWGDRLALRANVDLGLMLSQSDFLPDLAFKYVEAAAAKFSPETPDGWKLSVLSQKAKLLITRGNEADGVALMTKLHTENPYESELTYLLAQQAEKSNKIDDALALYAEISVLPMMERVLMQSLQQSQGRVSRDKLPSEAVRRLWKEKHGNTNELEEFLNKVYETKIIPVTGGKVAPRGPDGGSRVVLCELFTGAQCPPCVAADVATAGLEAAYGKTEVIVLRYHQHIPGPDPLANAETQERFEMYQGQGTPSLYINGRDFPGAGGFLQHVDAMYKRLRDEVDPTLKEKVPLKINLTAKAANNLVTITAKAGGMEKFPDTIRLRLVLAEDKIAFPAGNGIRFHEMVVRTMPGGVEGIEPDKGQLVFQSEVDLAELKTKLTKYLAKIETDVASEFEQKPLDFQALHLVAFLQDAKSGEVLQAATVPVAGTAGK